MIGGSAGGFFLWQQRQSVGVNTAEVQKRPKPQGNYIDLSSKSVDDAGVVVTGDTEIDSLKETDGSLKTFFDKPEQRTGNITIYGTYGKYATGDTAGVMTIWGPNKDGAIQPLAFSDIEVFSCKDLETINAPSELAVNLANGRSECLDGNGENREYKN